MKQDIFSYNQQLSQAFSHSPTPELFAKYIVSETIPPIADYQTAVQLVIDNYPRYTNTHALIIGAFLSSEWCEGNNQLLEILNQNFADLSIEERAITCFLNANHLRMRDKNYRENPAYIENLIKSTEPTVPFVFNYRELAKWETDKNKAQELLDLAKKNIIKVYTHKEIEALTLEQLVSPQFFIREHILGTHLSYVVYESLVDSI